MRRLLHPRVWRGAQLLDQRRPGWHRQVNLVMLDMSSPYWCVLGQVYRADSLHSGFSSGLARLRIHSAKAYGFYGGRRAWTSEVRHRLRRDARLGHDVDEVFRSEVSR